MGRPKGSRQSEETRRKISEGHKGIVFSEERKRNISKGKMGKKGFFRHSEESKRKIGLASRGNQYSKGRPGPNRGRHFSDEWVRRLSESHKGKIPSNKGKTMSEQTKQKCSKTWFKKGNNGWLGRKHSEKTLAKLREIRAVTIFPSRDTSIERIIQDRLTALGISFVKHKHFKIRDFYHQVDIFIEPNICIECDGDYWHGALVHTSGKYSQIHRDLIIDYELEKAGYKVLRFWETDIKERPNWCIDLVRKNLRFKPMNISECVCPTHQ